jgi:cytochrome c biogenesis protein CcmG, thiol:disulfide interchange protein DsbE
MRHAEFAFCNPVAVRKTLGAICALAVTAAVVVGFFQALGSDRAPQAAGRPLSLAEVSEPVAGAPPELAALRSRVNDLRPGGAKAFDAQLRALRGHPVVVNMWASWCDPCQFELPFLQREAMRRGARVAFLGVNVNDHRGAARQMAARYPMPYPSIEDPRGNLSARFHSKGLPTTAFYDARGKLVIVHQGFFPSQAKLAAAIDRYAVRG